MTVLSKPCSTCHEEKPLTEFHKCTEARDGKQSKCKACHVAYGIRVRRANPEKFRARLRGYYAKDPDRIKGYHTKSLQANPLSALMIRARSVIQIALASGTLVKGPCQVCGTDERVEGHHEDYTKPREVWWLCSIHHKARHKVLRTIEHEDNTPASDNRG